MVDNRLVEVRPLDMAVLKREGLTWLAEGDNKDYLSDQFLQVSAEECDDMLDATADLHQLAVTAAREVVADKLWSRMGIPEHAIPYIAFSLQHELEHHLVGRFDFAGGFDGIPLKLLEYNADTCSLMPETAIVQKAHFFQEQQLLDGQPFEQLLDSLTARLQYILSLNPELEPTLLLSSMGYEEDLLNCRLIEKAARAAGFTEVAHATLEEVIFAPDEGIFIESSPEEFERFDYWFKLIPWDFIAFEEPDLWIILENISRNDLAVILNPAYSMLLQAKSLLELMYDIDPDHPELLKATFSPHDFADKKYVKKPFFGRMGENIAVYDGSDEAKYETAGDYGGVPMLYQQLAPLNLDSEGHRYQASSFWTGEPAALCFRRQDDLIIDDDAEFVGHVVTP